MTNPTSISCNTKQPKGLGIFCFTELFERYGVFILQGLLVIFLVKIFHCSDERAYNVLGSFIALSCIMPMLGGWLGDRFLGFRNAVIIGAIVECIGFALMMVPKISFLYFALAVVAMGVGLLLPNIISLLGYLYETHDPRKDSGFTIFYTVINIGVVIALFFSGFIVRHFGWYIAFASAASALFLVLIVFIFGLYSYGLLDVGPKKELDFKKATYSLFTIILSIAVCYMLLCNETLAFFSFCIIAFLACFVVLFYAVKSPKDYRGKMIAFFLLLIISTIFWALYMQMFLSMTLFVKVAVNRNFFGFMVPTPTITSIEAIGLVLFGIPIAKLWTYLDKTKYSPSLPTKFSIGMLFLFFSFLFLVLCFRFLGHGELLPWYFLGVTYLVLAIAELVLTPIGWAMVSQLVPEKLIGLMTALV